MATLLSKRAIVVARLATRKWNYYAPSYALASSLNNDVRFVKAGEASNKNRLLQAAIALCGGIVGFGYLLERSKSSCKEAQAKNTGAAEAGERKPNLPDYRRADISAHNSKKTGIWVTYKNGVYDITSFVAGHPGGDKILLAAGGRLEPFWELYGAHKKAEVYEMLEELRIGNVHADDMKQVEVKSNDPYGNDPERHPALKVVNQKPFNAEIPVELLNDSFVTPNELFFTRNHLPVPVTDKKTFRIEVSGVGVNTPISLSVDELRQKFPNHTITATIQCAGNRRSDMGKYREVKGLAWGVGAISNARWTGVRLSDVLEAAGVTEANAAHIIFQGADVDVENMPYEASIPAETALDPRKDVLLAFEMNGQELSRDHGYPLRVVVPGTAGARHVKWVTKIIASKEESASHWYRKDYRAFSPSADFSNPNFDKAIPIQEYPIQSAICQPAPGATVSGGSDRIPVRGYAWSGGGRGIVRVDVSADGGKTWHEATLQASPQQDDKRHRQWAWTLWEAELPLEAGFTGPIEIVCKATDTSLGTQPETAAGIWNMRGLVHNAWHRIQVTVEE